MTLQHHKKYRENHIVYHVNNTEIRLYKFIISTLKNAKDSHLEN